MNLHQVETAADPANDFYIPATTSLQERHPRTLKNGDTFAVFDQRGDMRSGPGSPEGLFHSDTRYLSHMEFRLSGTQPLLLSSTLRDDNLSLTCDLTNPDLFEDGGIVLERDIIHVRRSKFLWQAGCYERIAFRNFSDRHTTIQVQFLFDADFADLFEVRGMHRERRGRRHEPIVGPDTVTLAYTGLDDRTRTTRLRFDPAPTSINGGRAAFRVPIEPQGSFVLFVEVQCNPEPVTRPAREMFLLSMRDARRALHSIAARAASVATSNGIFNEAIRRSIADLYMLVTDTPFGLYPYAGTPWFSAPFGRDALITALQTLWIDPELAKGVLRYLAANQATEFDAASDAEPGKILHEVRHGEMAELHEVPFRRYYGSIDSTPLFVLLAGAYLERTGDAETIDELRPNIAAALAWIDKYGDRDGDGFVEYGRMSPDGLLNQGWKDSHDSISHADGTLAVGPIALCEVQGYVYAAKRAAARIAARFGDIAARTDLDRQADQLQRNFERAFWCPKIGMYALALDGEKRPCAVRSSNAGHTLMSGIASAEHAVMVAAEMMGSTMSSGWGIRTLGASEARYNPMSYHNGSVWPHDNAMIGLGFAHYGLRREAARLFESLFGASIYIEMRRLPELFCGFPRRHGQGPTAYPVACSPQAWAAATPIALLSACLGISFEPANRTVVFDRPVLPDFLDEVVLRGLSIGPATVDVMIRRAGDEVALNVLRRNGLIRVVVVS